MIAISKTFGRPLSESLPKIYFRVSTALKANSAIASLVIITALGFATFYTGLHNQFILDDYAQIVSNPSVHSLTHIVTIFNGGTIDSGTAANRLVGVYYRPLMSTTYALVYTLFGPQPFAFHLFQLCLHILATFVLFLILRYFFRPGVSLILSLFFLVHPINSQAVFTIADMQEPLFLDFGLAGFWLLLRFQDRGIKYLVPAAACLLLSLLSKETGVLFVVIFGVYEFFFDRKRFYWYIGMMAVVASLYLALKLHAVGFHNPHSGPIDELNFWSRMVNAPAIIFFYISAMVFPLHLAHAYNWVYTSISLGHFLLPLAVDILAILAAVAAAFTIHRRSDKRHVALFAFFAAWLAVGLGAHIQIIPLDLTACDSWFYFPFVGLLGMIATLIDAFPPRRPKLLVTAALIILCILAVRTSVRGFDYRDQYTLAFRDSAISESDFFSQTKVAIYLASQGRPRQALVHAQESVGTYPSIAGYDALGLSFLELKRYADAQEALAKALELNDQSPQKQFAVYDYIGTLALYFGNPGPNIKTIQSGLRIFPGDGNLWQDLAILEYPTDPVRAQRDISIANKYGQTTPYIYDHIMNDQPLVIDTPKITP
jgi:tetratricopeptide (TPR) repeat protein